MFSKTAEYAIRATIFIAQKSDPDHKIGIEEISKAIDSPASFTAKILQMLTRGQELISSVRGPNGGFFMTAEARKLPLLRVLELVGEDGVLKKCVLGLKECSEEKPCPLHHRYRKLKPELARMFEEMQIGQLAGELDAGATFVGNKGRGAGKRPMPGGSKATR
ncbi:MAG: Rrf2 family transcriptional regulator [Chitinophagaceae bacterium]|jgi:Rrf2 family protein|nr:Rrf2 family transcriptional regulator [Chitinophagaceae bacterium]